MAVEGKLKLMQIKVFTLPLQPNEEQTEELNHFLRANKVVDIKKELANLGGNSVWTFCIVYLETATKTTEANNFSKGQKIDYREILPPDIFERFAALRKLRKAIAEKETVPAYAVFTDAELAEVAKLATITPDTLKSIPGIGQKKIEKYGSYFCQFGTDRTNDETQRQPDRTDSQP